MTYRGWDEGRRVSRHWPVNELAPPIDQLFVDFDERLWVRDYHFADQDSVTWRVCSEGRGQQA